MKLCSTQDCGTPIADDEDQCSKCKIKQGAVSIQQQELARRVLSKRRLLPFVQRMMPEYMAGWVHKDICLRLEQFARDIIDQKSPRLMIMMPPRSGKSQLASTFFPAWFIGNNPDKEIIACSYSASLSMSFSRAIREVLRDKSYQNVFKECRLNKDSQSVENWLTTEHGGYLAAGVGGPITGRGAHLLIIDDPVKNFEEADSATQRDAVWNWWTTTAYTRLAPGGGTLVIQCMTGDTPVLMADGSEKSLRDVNPGDQVATYEDDQLTTAKVLNHRSNGIDRVIAIKTTCGKIVRANERHPFLVERDGVRTWVRVRDLRTGDFVVSTDATDLPGLQLNEESAVPVKPNAPIIRRTQTLLTLNKGTGENTKAKLAQTKDVMNLSPVKDFAPVVTIKSDGLRGTIAGLLRKIEMPTSSIATVDSHWTTITSYLRRKMVSALSATSIPVRKILGRTGVESSASTIVTTPTQSGDSSATTVTSQQVTSKTETMPCPSQLTSNFTLTTIASIEECGEEEVFDVQIERTENFIANGLVSHNTRWHHDDLSGRILQQFEEAKANNIDLPEWDVVSYPAIAERDEQFRKAGEALHPERYDLKQLNAIKATVGARDWAALYQQKPTLDEGAYFREPFFRYWQMDPPEESSDRKKPEMLTVYATWDLALGKKETNDFTASIVFGVDTDENIYVLDMVHEKIDAMEIVERMIDQFEQWKPTATGIEKTHMQMAIGPFLNKRIRERKAYSMYVYEQAPGRRDKELRARSIQGRIQQGKVFFPRNAPWLHVLITEMLQFPAGIHDDLVDCLSYAGLLLEELISPTIPVPPKKPSWKDNLYRYVRGGDSIKSHMSA